MYVFFSAIFAAIAYMILKLKLPSRLKAYQAPKYAFGFIFVYLAAMSFGTGAIAYNDSGKCTHIRTALGTEHAECELGWYFRGWGETTSYPHFITIVNDTNSEASNTNIEDDYLVRMRDNWAARVSQTTRFKLPTNEDKFLVLAQAYNSPEAISQGILRPAIDASLDHVASGLSMDDYYLNHKRNQFREKYLETLKNGVENTKNVAELDPQRGIGRMKKGTETKPQKQYIPHNYSAFGIRASLIELHHFRPDSDYTAQLKERKAASMKRTLMIEKRMSEEQELRLAKARQQIAVTNKSTVSLVEQARITAIAEAKLKVAAMEKKAELEQVASDIKIATLRLKRAKIEAEASRVEAQTKAYVDKAISSASTPLDKRLNAYVETNRIWAKTLADRRSFMPASSTSQDGGELQEVNALMDHIATGALKATETDSKR